MLIPFAYSLLVLRVYGILVVEDETQPFYYYSDSYTISILEFPIP